MHQNSFVTSALVSNAPCRSHLETEQAHTFGDLGSTAKKAKEKIRDLGRSGHYFQGSREHRPPPCGGLSDEITDTQAGCSPTR